MTVLACAAACVAGANAIEIDTGNPDLTFRVDTLVRYNLGVRAEHTDPLIVNNSAFDESDRKFHGGQVIANRLDLFTETDLVYKGKTGARLSGAAWYDH